MATCSGPQTVGGGLANVDHKSFRAALTKSDTAGEVSFVAAKPLTHPVSTGLRDMNCACFRLRQQYQKCARADVCFNPFQGICPSAAGCLSIAVFSGQ